MKIKVLTILVLFLTAVVSIQRTDAQERKIVNFPGDVPFDFGEEPMRFLENERVKLGLNMDLGGAVTYLEDKANATGNMINSCDWGRQIQLSYYSGPWPFIGPNGEKPSEHWAELGWNPIQSGDFGGFRSQVLEFKKIDDSTFFLRTRPMLWPHTGVPAECVFECRYQLIDNGFILDATIVNSRSDKTQYSCRDQETPAVYTNAPWYKYVSYLGDKPFEDQPLTTLVDKNDGQGWPPAQFYSPERWTAVLDKNDRGLGVYQPLCAQNSAGFCGGDDAKGKDLGDKSGETGYISPFERAILDWNIRYSYRTVFIVGSIDEIRSTVYQFAKHDLPKRPNWLFKNDRQRWTYYDAFDEGWPIVDALKINITSEKRAAAISPKTFWKTSDAPIVEIEAAFVPNDENNNGGNNVDDSLELLFTPVSPADSLYSFAIAKREQAKQNGVEVEDFPTLPVVKANVPIKFDGQKRTLRVDLSNVEGYVGAMKELELVFPQRNGKVVLYKVEFVEK